MKIMRKKNDKSYLKIWKEIESIGYFFQTILILKYIQIRIHHDVFLI